GKNAHYSLGRRKDQADLVGKPLHQFNVLSSWFLLVSVQLALVLYTNVLCVHKHQRELYQSGIAAYRDVLLSSGPQNPSDFELNMFGCSFCCMEHVSKRGSVHLKCPYRGVEFVTSLMWLRSKYAPFEKQFLACYWVFIKTEHLTIPKLWNQHRYPQQMNG
ncbi:hypothetical protein H1C71_040716, partial [Ictidomys tridecemlineatus]